MPQSQSFTHVKITRTMSCSMEYPGGRSNRLLSQIARSTQALASMPRLKVNRYYRIEKSYLSLSPSHLQLAKASEALKQLTTIAMSMVMLPIPNVLQIGIVSRLIGHHIRIVWVLIGCIWLLLQLRFSRSVPTFAVVAPSRGSCGPLTPLTRLAIFLIGLCWRPVFIMFSILGPLLPLGWISIARHWGPVVNALM